MSDDFPTNNELDAAVEAAEADTQAVLAANARKREAGAVQQPTGVLMTYIEVKYADGTTCTCERKDVSDMTYGADGFTTREVQMTKAEFDAMSEFQG